MNTKKNVILTITYCSLAIACGTGYTPSEVPEELTTVDPCTLNAPVCGADGITYANACSAEIAGATVANQTPCGCGAAPQNKGFQYNVEGTWAANQPWPVQIVLQNGIITRYDYISNCAPGLGCAASGPAVSGGTYQLSNALVHLNWTHPAAEPGIYLPELYLIEDKCDDGDTYLVQITPDEVFYGKQ